MKVKLLIVFLILIGVFSCRKDIVKNYETVVPLDYFPAYPGSYWVYDNNDTLKVLDYYQPYIFNSSSYSSSPNYDTLMLPKLILNGIYNKGEKYAFVKEYSISKPHNSNYKIPPFITFLTLTENGKFSISEYYQGEHIVGKTIKKDTSVLIGNTMYNNVIITIHYNEACSGYYSQEECASVREYYAKGVGLIKRESKNPVLDTVYTKTFEIVDFYINK